MSMWFIRTDEPDLRGSQHLCGNAEHVLIDRHTAKQQCLISQSEETLWTRIRAHRLGGIILMNRYHAKQSLAVSGDHLLISVGEGVRRAEPYQSFASPASREGLQAVSQVRDCLLRPRRDRGPAHQPWSDLDC